MPTSGSLPAGWSTANSTSGYSIRLGANNITGGLPASWQGVVWRSLFVDLGSNRLSGVLPAEWNTTGAMGNASMTNQAFNLRCVWLTAEGGSERQTGG